MELATIIVPAGELKETLRKLLSLADRPQDIWYPGYGSEIDVPEYLLARYQGETAPKPRRSRTKKESEET